MKKNLQIKFATIALLCLMTLPGLAQVYQFQEGFVSNAPPAGWITTNVAWSTTHNNGLYNGIYSAKLKPNESFLICKAVNTADVLRFYCQVRDTTAATNFHLFIEKSTDKVTWTPVAQDPFNKADTNWQMISIDIKDNSPQLYLSFHATAQGGTAALGLCYIDDVSVTKMEVSPSDATLNDLTYNGISVDGFAATMMDYSVEVPYFIDQVLMGGTPNNPSATMTITNPTNMRGTEAERTGKVVVKAPDGVTTNTYQILFTVSEYIYKTGFVTTGASMVPFDGWTTAYTYVTTTIPMGDHGYFPGPAAFRFIRGQTDKVGFLNTAKYTKSDTLGFWMAVDQGDGVEKMLIEKRVLGGIKVTIANLTATDLGPDWKEFKFAIKENDSTEIIFTPTITPESPVTRIYMDDLYLTGKPVTQGLGELQRTHLTLTPNPSSDYVVVSSGMREMQIVMLSDMTGRMLFEAESGGGGMTIDLRGIPSGVYVITCRSASRIATGKIIRN